MPRQRWLMQATFIAQLDPPRQHVRFDIVSLGALT